MKKSEFSAEAEEAKEWFLNSVTFEGEPYIMDLEQAEAVVDDSKNALVVARAGSGKTRTLVAKIIYLVAKRGVKPDEIMAFVFNANAAAEINERLSQMLVDGHPVINKSKIAMTFHAFSRKVVYDLAHGKEHCGDILAGEKDEFIQALVLDWQKNEAWARKMRQFIRGKVEQEESKDRKKRRKKRKGLTLGFLREQVAPSDTNEVVDDLATSDLSINKIVSRPAKIASKRKHLEQGEIPEELLVEADSDRPLSEEELRRFAGAMAQFVNRAQQKFLGSGASLPEHLKEYREKNEVSERENLFLELGAECYRRYHWRLLDKKSSLPDFEGFRTDFNLIVSWAAQIIASGRAETNAILTPKKYLLIDEYQDFSQLFLAAVLAIREVATEAKLFAVGDDWQAINRFAGSDVDYFKNFDHYFPEDTRILQISTNYRCHYQIVDTARTFMNKAMREKGNFAAFSKKPGEIFLADPNRVSVNCGLVDFDSRADPEDQKYQKIVRRLVGQPPKKAVIQYLKTLVEIVKENAAAKEILVLHRNNETNLQNLRLEKLEKALPRFLNQLGMREPPAVKFMTMHRSKGLESEVVILLEADDGIIPRIHPDSSLYRFFGETEEVVLDDQKRLFYVAMTRAKKRLYIIHKTAGKKSEEGFIPFLGHNIRKWHEND